MNIEYEIKYKTLSLNKATENNPYCIKYYLFMNTLTV